MNKKTVVFIASLLLILGSLAGLIWFLRANNQIKVCESLQPGIKAGDLISHFGVPHEDAKTGELRFKSSLFAAGPIRAKVNTDGKVIMLKCSEDSPINWTA